MKFKIRCNGERAMLKHDDELILKSDVIELIDRYYDKFTYESDADELIVEVEHIRGVGVDDGN